MLMGLARRADVAVKCAVGKWLPDVYSGNRNSESKRPCQTGMGYPYLKERAEDRVFLAVLGSLCSRSPPITALEHPRLPASNLLGEMSQLRPSRRSSARYRESYHHTNSRATAPASILGAAAQRSFRRDGRAV